MNPSRTGTQLCVAGDPAPCTSPASACARCLYRPNTRLHVMLLELNHRQPDGWMGYTTSARGCILLKTAARRGQGGDYRGQQSIDRARAMYGLAGWEKQGEAAGAVSGAGTNARCKTNKLQGKAGRGRARGTPAQSSSTQRVVRQRHRKLALTDQVEDGWALCFICSRAARRERRSSHAARDKCLRGPLRARLLVSRALTPGRACAAAPRAA